jgi:hypothetical protein
MSSNFSSLYNQEISDRKTVIEALITCIQENIDLTFPANRYENSIHLTSIFKETADLKPTAGV